MPAPAPGLRLGRYVLDKRLGVGGMAEVWEAHDERLSRNVAIKIVLESIAKDKQFLLRFQQEARLAASLEHPHILPIYDFGTEGETAYIVTSLLPGGTLKDRLAKPVPIETAIRWLASIGSALDHAHAHGVVHRDVKPANILFDRSGRIFLSDFGLAKSLEAANELTAAGTVLGTPAYMSPEQGRGRALDGRSDQYSLGAIAYRALAGRLPFDAESAMVLLQQTLFEPPPAPSQFNPSLPATVDDVLLKVLAKDPTVRYPTCLAFVEALARGFGLALPESSGPMAASGAAPSGDTTATQALPRTGVSPAPPSSPPSVPVRTPPAIPPHALGNTSATVQQTKGKSPALLGLLVAAGVAVAGYLAYTAKTPDGPPPTETPTPAPSPRSATPHPVEPRPTQAPNGERSDQAPPAQEPPPSSPPDRPAPTAIPMPTRIVVVERTLKPTAAPRPTHEAREAREPRPEPTETRAEKERHPERTPEPEERSARGGSEGKPADYTFSAREGFKINVDPEEAWVFLDGRYIGISDDWDDSGGGALLSFASPGRHRLRFAHRDRGDLLVDITLSPTADERTIEVEKKLPTGKPSGPTGPEGKIRSPDYKSRGPVRFKVEPPDATVTVDGRAVGPVSRYVDQDLELRETAVHDVVLTAPGHEAKKLRIIVSPAVKRETVVVKEKLKKSK